MLTIENLQEGEIMGREPFFADIIMQILSGKS